MEVFNFNVLQFIKCCVLFKKCFPALRLWKLCYKFVKIWKFYWFALPFIETYNPCEISILYIGLFEMKFFFLYQYPVVLSPLVKRPFCPHCHVLSHWFIISQTSINWVSFLGPPSLSHSSYYCANILYLVEQIFQPCFSS